MAESEAATDGSGMPPPRVPRRRRIVGASLLMIGVVLVPVSLSAVWVRNTLLATR